LWGGCGLMLVQTLLKEIVTVADRNEFLTAPMPAHQKLEWITPKISLMAGPCTEGKEVRTPDEQTDATGGTKFGPS